MVPEWTLDDLVARVVVALDAADYTGAPNGRVRDVPDRRAVRYYTTIGLLDRPAMRGRTALYGPRHLAQLVAIKRRQAQGRSLTEIQSELLGLTDAVLAQVADLPPDTAGEPRASFWTSPPSAPDSRPVAPGRDPGAVLTGVPLGGGVILLLPAAPDPEVLAELRDAAGPLLDLLTARGLLAGDWSAT